MRSKLEMLVACDLGTATHDKINAFIKSFPEHEGVFDNAILEVYSRDVSAARTKLANYLTRLQPRFA